MAMVKSVQDYLVRGCGRCSLFDTPDCKVHRWREELLLMREMANASELTETSKWGVPCYTFQGKNVLLISAFKEYCAMSFFKGALLKDPMALLEKQGENSHAERILKITDIEQLYDVKSAVMRLIVQAVQLEKEGRQVDKNTSAMPYPQELVDIMREDEDFRHAFDRLTPGRQRGYLLYFSAARQSATRTSRIKKYMPAIREGKGIHDR